MFKRKTVYTELFHEAKAVSEATHKLMSAQTRCTYQQLRWASGEENRNLFSMFGKLAEIEWMWHTTSKQMEDSQIALSRAFKDIFQEDKVVEDAKKDLQNCTSKLSKLQKLVDSARKKGDLEKSQSLEVDTLTQSTLGEHLSSSVEAQSQSLELHKVQLLKQALRQQTETCLNVSNHCQQLFSAQLQVIDLLPGTALQEGIEEVNKKMALVVSQASESLGMFPPSNGGIDTRKLAATSSSPLPSPSITRRVATAGNGFHRTSSSILRGGSKHSYDATSPSVKERRLSVPEVQLLLDSKELCELDKPKMLSNLTGLDRSSEVAPEDSPKSDRAYEFCEIYIPEPNSKEKPILVQTGFRRTTSNSSPISDRMKVQRTDSLDTNPLSGAESAPFSSSEELQKVGGGGGGGGEGGGEGDSERGYAMLTILTAEDESGRESVTSSEPGYAEPADVVPNYLDQANVGNRSDSSSPYESVEDIRRMREIQNKRKRRQPHKTERNDSPSGDETGQTSPNDDGNSGGYSRPFDALTGIPNPLKVTTDSQNKKLNISPIPWQQGEKVKSPNTEKSARSLHLTTKPPADKPPVPVEKPQLTPRIASPSEKPSQYHGKSPPSDKPSLPRNKPSRISPPSDYPSTASYMENVAKELAQMRSKSTTDKRPWRSTDSPPPTSTGYRSKTLESKKATCLKQLSSTIGGSSIESKIAHFKGANKDHSSSSENLSSPQQTMPGVKELTKKFNSNNNDEEEREEEEQSRQRSSSDASELRNRLRPAVVRKLKSGQAQVVSSVQQPSDAPPPSSRHKQ